MWMVDVICGSPASEILVQPGVMAMCSASNASTQSSVLATSYEDAQERSTFQGTFNFQWYWMQRTHVEELWWRVNELGSEGQVF
jgi:hypothetical protein